VSVQSIELKIVHSLSKNPAANTMSQPVIPDITIEQVAKHINVRNNKNYGIPVIGHEGNVETPQVFTIIPFDQIDNTDRRFYAIDGSYNSEQFYNGLSIGIYCAGYLCFHKGKQVRVNSTDDPLILGQAYYPKNILVASDVHRSAIYDELLGLEPVRKLLDFWSDSLENIFPVSKESICVNLSTLLGFCQEILEIALILEVAERSENKSGDYILRDGTLRPLQVKQPYLVRVGKYLHERGMRMVAITKQSPIKMELSYSFKQIDNYLQEKLKHHYPFTETDPKRKKLCCWFEVSSDVLDSSYGTMFAKKGITGGRGFGLFFVARLDYVEKLQNYDWVVADLNIFDAIPGIGAGNLIRDSALLSETFRELTRLTQEHYILGYPYPLAEVHNFISLKKDFKQEIVNRVRFSLYSDQQMDHVDIENLFLDTHERF
jgi:NurA domain